MTGPDYSSIDHVHTGIPLDESGEGIQNGSEHTRHDPATIPPEHDVPLAVFIRQMPPLRAYSRHPHDALQVGSVVACGSACGSATDESQARSGALTSVRSWMVTLAPGMTDYESFKQDGVRSEARPKGVRVRGSSRAGISDHRCC